MSDTEQTNRLGVNILDQRVLEAGHIFREQSISDSGIDAQIEVKDRTKATGRLIAAQIKAGPSYFSKEDENGFWHYVSDRHRDLWINHSLPVILVLCDIDKRACYYEIATEETCVRTANGWKILVSKNKTIGTDSSLDLASIASPIVAASDYSIHAEQDQSHANARRVSLDIVVHPGSKPVSKPLLGAIVRAALKDGQSSQYHRDELSERVLGGRPIDVVWGFVYLRDVDRESASWICRFQWISPSLEASSRPHAYEGEQDGSGLVIDWKGNTELSKFIDERRASKADFLKHVDKLLAQLPDVQQGLDSLLERGDQSPHATGFAVLAEEFESMWDDSFAAPNECQRLNQAIQELLATVGNAGLIWAQRMSRRPSQVRSLMSSYRDKLDRLDADISFLRRDVR
ncbi:DUF4365 domain-containing protein [Thioclava sp. JE_KL1]|uniref:DUF4365 domain-containing protein n=1 Tax=Thioclava sp. JE_KL1 TaxID=2651187 RepID=UPI00128D80FA|nr:DUF4365 domain-containing protein [Thioclava sp. JE_KL1]MPQ95662.1 DUF4365 domain-containing protein [Thioclava sp. JE_KL1]